LDVAGTVAAGKYISIQNYEIKGCSGTTTCTDSDGGKDVYVKGNMIDQNGANKTDFCSDSSKVGEYYCNNNLGSFTTLDCPSTGYCSDGACVKRTVNETVTCTDSDGGLKYDVKGISKGMEEVVINGTKVLRYAERKDICVKDNQIPNPGLEEGVFEYYCQDNILKVKGGLTESHVCENGCSNGACVPSPESNTCPDLVNKVANPSDFVDQGIGYTNSGNNSYRVDWWIDDNTYKGTEYYASWWTNFDNSYNQISYDVVVFDDLNAPADKLLEQLTSYQVCVLRNHWSSANKENKVYVCNWDVLNQQQDIENSGSENRNILWSQDNVLVQVNTYIGRQLSNEEITRISQERVQEFLDDLKDNREEFVDWQEFNVDYPLSRQIELSLGQCESEISLDTCSPNWACNIEPAVCPPHGQQNKVCRDISDCGNNPIQQKVSCTPGLCSGCLISSNDGGQSSCIPYGTRMNEFRKFVQLSAQKESAKVQIVPNGQQYTVDVDIIDSNTIQIDTSVENLPPLRAGEKYELYDGTLVRINYIDYRSEIEFYVGIEFFRDDPSYCNYDGNILIQRIKDSGGNWAQCQNNYECESNLCSGGECVEINDAIKEAKGFKNLFFRALCRVTNLFDDSGYNQCLVDNLGDVPSSGGVIIEQDIGDFNFIRTFELPDADISNCELFEFDLGLLPEGDSCTFADGIYQYNNPGIDDSSAIVETHGLRVSSSNFVEMVNWIAKNEDLEIEFEGVDGGNSVAVIFNEKDISQVIVFWTSGNNVVGTSFGDWNRNIVDDDVLQKLIDAYLEKYPSDFSLSPTVPAPKPFNLN
ncbi:MAG: hypothetical protein AABY22_21000, partial [Nanoarchaeota archaeon]